MSSRRIESEDFKSSKRSKFIRNILQDGSKGQPRSMRKSYSPSKVNKATKYRFSKPNIGNAAIMRRQLNAIKDISPPTTKNMGYSFVYDDNFPTTRKRYEEKRVLQQIKKSKPKINPPSPHKKIRKHLNTKVFHSQVREGSFNSTLKFSMQPSGKFSNLKFHRSQYSWFEFAPGDDPQRDEKKD